MTAHQATAPRWFTLQSAARYCGLSIRTLQNYEAAGLLKTRNIIQPGATRGRKLIDRIELDELIESGSNVKTTAPICQLKQKGAALA